MQATKLILPSLALGAAALFVTPPEAVGFNKLGGSLNIGQRDWRLRNNFQDGAANNNLTPDANWPGHQGAAMSLWKAAAEWGSGPHGDGSGDPSQGVVGSGLADFDFAFGGNALGAGNGDDNIVSTIPACGGGTFAFVSGGGGNWEMRFCEEWTWSDGPELANGGRIDIQGIATHEFGHSLGLDHQVGSAVMKPSTFNGNDSRNLFNDDRNGLQCIYGAKSATKPEITAVSVNGDTITITGFNFDAVDNQIWFTNANVTDWNADPIVRFNGVASTAGGTMIEVCAAGDAGPGDIHVRTPGNDGANLSNGWPLDITHNPVDATASFHNGTACNTSNYTVVTPPRVGLDWVSTITVDPGIDRTLLAISLGSPACHPGGFKPAILNGTELLALPPYVLPHDQDDFGNHVIPVSYDCDIIGQSFCTQGFGLSFGPLVRTGYNAQIVTVGNRVP